MIRKVPAINQRGSLDGRITRDVVLGAYGWTMSDVERMPALLDAHPLDIAIDVARGCAQLKQRRLEHHHVSHSLFRNFVSPVRMSIGSGKTMVVFFSTPISVSVCR